MNATQLYRWSPHPVLYQALQRAAQSLSLDLGSTSPRVQPGEGGEGR
jgi:hypothetical protein